MRSSCSGKRSASVSRSCCSAILIFFLAKYLPTVNPNASKDPCCTSGLWIEWQDNIVSTSHVKRYTEIHTATKQNDSTESQRIKFKQQQFLTENAEKLSSCPDLDTLISYNLQLWVRWLFKYASVVLILSFSWCLLQCMLMHHVHTVPPETR